MRPRSILSLCLYYMGDYICECGYKVDIRYMWWWQLYGKLMLISYKLDTHEQIWNKTEEDIIQPNYITGDEDQPIHQI